MMSRARNRYAALGENDEVPSSPASSAQSPDLAQRLTSDDGDDGADWQEVRPKKLQVNKLPTPVVVSEKPRSSGAMPSFKILTSLQHNADSRQLHTVSSLIKHDSPKKTPGLFENWCGVCSNKFPSKPSLLSHIKQSPKHDHYCNLCKRVFKDRNSLQNHIDNAVGHDIVCNICLSAFQDRNGLRNHFENSHNADHEFACLVCLVAFGTRFDMDNHLRKAEKHVSCHTCCLRFASQDERDEHWVRTMTHKHCLQPGCDFDAQTAAALDEHVKTDHFWCYGCGSILPSQTKLNTHLQTCLTFAEGGPPTEKGANLETRLKKHEKLKLSCWACAVPMKAYASLINHLESGGCVNFPDAQRLTQFLGQWWFSPLYMDVSLHAQIRTGRLDIAEMTKWVDEGVLHPYICRAVGCQEMFNRLSSLVLHVESNACDWHTDTIGLDMLARDFKLEFGFSDDCFGTPIRSSTGEQYRIDSGTI